MPRICVDRGTMPHLLSGADLMIPGIVNKDSLSPLEEGDYVSLYLVGKESSFCIARAAMSSKQIAENSKGRAFITLHYLGDSLWNFQN